MKNIEEIKNEVAKEHISSGERSTIEQLMTEVAKRYSQQYIDEYEIFKKGFEALQEAVLKSAERNKELVEMLEFIFYKTNFQSHFPTTSIKVKNILFKHATNDNGKEESC